MVNCHMLGNGIETLVHVEIKLKTYNEDGYISLSYSSGLQWACAGWMHGCWGHG